MIPAGELKHSAEFQRPEPVKDSSGEYIDTWVTVARVFVGIKPVSIDNETGDTVNFAVSSFELFTRYSQILATTPAPAWCFANVPMSNLSSTQIRAAGKWSAASSE